MNATQKQTVWMLLGCTCFFAWMHCLSLSLVTTPGHIAGIGSPWFVSNGGALVCTAAYFALGRRVDSVARRPWFAVCAVVVMVAATAAYHFLQDTPLVVTALALSCGPLAFWTLWGAAFRALPGEEAQKRAIYGGIILSLVLYVLLCLAPAEVRTAAMFLLPCASAAAMHLCCAEAAQDTGGQEAEKGEGGEEEQKCEEPARPRGRTFGLPLVFYIVVFSIPFNYLRFSSELKGAVEPSLMLMALVVVVGILLVLLAAERAVAPKGLSVFPASSLCFSVVALLLVQFQVGSLLVSTALAYVGYYSFVAVMHVRIGQVIARTSASPTRVFTLAMGVNAGGLLIGTFLALLSATSIGAWVSLALVCLTYLLFALGFAMFPRSMKEMVLSRAGFKQEEPKEPGNQYMTAMIESIGRQCHVVAEQFGLSTREEEVLCYVMRGWSLQLIADEECVSRNTVKTHVYHIYQKLGVHTREELSLIVEAVTAESSSG